jgi:subtilisin family serine protease
VLNSDGDGSWTDIIAGIDWVIEEHNKSTTKRSVANVSLGGEKSTAVNSAIARATEAGIVMVVAAGNADTGKKISQQLMLNGNHEHLVDLVVSHELTTLISMHNQPDACNTSPASEPSAITVGSSTNNDSRSDFSNWGAW